ncbi:unnamed protein product [Clavelina lepadiformis]|uniref:protein-tyrosine-phosphatase n=1 Tax=Clavelina lepadiformis TaxID=159417 RepID=A0ABP0FX80_CLALP
MPVSRNLSLPSSIEARKFKKRPDELHDLKHCLSMPSSSQNNNSNNNSDTCNDPSDVNDTPMLFHSSASVHLNAPTPKSPSRAADVQRARSPANRGTLSQPCLSEPASVGPTSIFPHLFLGSQEDVKDKEMLTENDISNVLNVSCKCERPAHLDDDHFRRIAVLDNYQEKITPHLDEAVNFIEAARKKNERVLVHCLAGVSRSATVAIAYVMYYLRLNFDDAYRFVKDKRPTISPNFNFLGQLMEFEEKLRKSGHMDKPRTGSIPNISEYKIEAKPKANAVPRIEVSRPVSNETAHQLVTNKITTGNPNTPSSSFCRRRRGPALDKLSFSRSSSHQPCIMTDTVEDAHLYSNSCTRGGAGVVLDLRVTVPTSEPHSRRLGSDGVEDGDDDAPDHHFEPAHLKLGSTIHKSNSLPRSMPTFSMNKFRECNATPTASHSDAFFKGEMLSVRHCNGLRSSTAPNTPAVMRLASAPHSPCSLVLTAQERLAPRDVEMIQADEDNDASPPSPSSRNRSQTDPTSLYLQGSYSYEQPGCYNSIGSPLPDKFVSRKTKSPKVLKKSRSSGYQVFLNNKQQGASSSYQAPIPFRARTRDTSPMSHRPTQECASQMHCESPGTVGLSSLTLYSPVLAKSDPMEVVGTKCAIETPRNNGGLPKSTPRKTCINSTTRSATNSAASRTQTTDSTSCSKITSFGTPEPFKLASSADLKLSWRKRQRSANTAENAGPGTRTPTSSTVLNRCGNLEIITCS